MTNTRAKLIVFLILAALITAALWQGFEAPAMPMDEGLLLVYPELVLKGQLPYRDFDCIFGPGNFAILSAAYAAFGTNIFVERAVGLAYRLLILLAVFGIAQRWGTTIAAGCMFVTALILAASTDLMAHTWIAGVAFALCTLWILATADLAWRAFAGGVLAGIALLCRVDFTPALVISLLPLFCSMKTRSKKRFVAGLALALLPLGWLAFVIGPAQVVDSLFLIPVFRLNPQSRLSVSAANTDLLSLFWLYLTISAVNLGAGIVAWRAQPSRERGRLLLSAGLLGLGLIHYALQRFDYMHVVLAALVSLSIAPLSILVLLCHTGKRLPDWLAPILATLAVVVAMQVVLPVFTRYFYRDLRVSFGLSPVRQASKAGEQLEPGDKGVFVTRHGRSFAFGTSQAAQAAEKALAELERVSSSGQRLFVGTTNLRLPRYCDTYVYHLLPQLRPATYFIELNAAAIMGHHLRLADEIETADWLLLNRTWELMDRPEHSAQFGSDNANRVVRSQFDLWWQGEPYFLLRHKRLSNLVMPLPGP